MNTYFRLTSFHFLNSSLMYIYTQISLCIHVYTLRRFARDAIKEMTALFTNWIIYELLKSLFYRLVFLRLNKDNGDTCVCRHTRISFSKDSSIGVIRCNRYRKQKNLSLELFNFSLILSSLIFIVFML